MKNNTKMKKVFKNYSSKMGRDQSYFRFMYDGRCIGQNDTPESVGYFVFFKDSWAWKMVTILIVNLSKLVVSEDDYLVYTIFCFL